MSRFAAALIALLAGICLVAAPHAGRLHHPAAPWWTLPGIALQQAMAQTAVPPNTGHGFLIDRHLAAGVTCNACHTTMPFQPATTQTCLSCHGGTYDKLAAMTATSVPNPHPVAPGPAALRELPSHPPGVGKLLRAVPHGLRHQGSVTPPAA